MALNIFFSTSQVTELIFCRGLAIFCILLWSSTNCFRGINVTRPSILLLLSRSEVHEYDHPAILVRQECSGICFKVFIVMDNIESEINKESRFLLLILLKGM